MIDPLKAPIPETDLFPVVEGIFAGHLVPFLGAGANLCGAGNEIWNAERPTRLPRGQELTEYLASRFHYPAGSFSELARVSQYADTMAGRGPLDDELRPLFDKPFSTTALHEFLARVPARRRAANYPRTSDKDKKHLLIVTTNYDDVMERAFLQAEEPFHVITYRFNRVSPFEHKTPDGKSNVIGKGKRNKYDKLDSDDYPVILKIHGSVQGDNFVITEDDYIDYLSFGDIALALPMGVKDQLTRSSFLFLGYALQDWNLRAFLRRIWREQQSKNYKSWAVMAEISEFERKYWLENEVDILTRDLHYYIDRLDDLFTRELLKKLPD